MEKDHRYLPVKIMLLDGLIPNFKDIFRIVPKTIVAKDAGIKIVSFNMMIDNPNRFSIGKLRLIAHFIEVNPEVLVNLVLKAANEKDKLSWGQTKDGVSYKVETIF